MYLHSTKTGPRGARGVQKTQKDLRFFTLVRFSANIQLKLHKIWKNTKKQSYFLMIFFVDFEGFLQYLQFWPNISAKTNQSEKH